MAFKMSEEEIDRQTAITDKFAKKWIEDGCPELKEEDIAHLYLNVSKYFPNLRRTTTYNGIPCNVADIYNLKELTVEDILDQTNIETRRLFISKYGTHKFLRDGGATAVTEEDARGYQIVQFPVEDSSWYFLKMINSTLEPVESGIPRSGMVDGGMTDEGYKIYFLRLPKLLIDEGNITNEKAVAWSFNSKPVPGFIYNNGTANYLEQSKSPDYKFEDDKREFSYQARQGDVHIRLLALSMEDLLAGKMYDKDGYDSDTYRPDVES